MNNPKSYLYSMNNYPSTTSPKSKMLLLIFCLVALPIVASAIGIVDDQTRLSLGVFYDEPLVSQQSKSLADCSPDLYKILSNSPLSEGDNNSSFYEEYLDNAADSPWSISLSNQLGRYYFSKASYSKGIAYLEKCIQLGKENENQNLKKVVDQAYGELLEFYSHIGNDQKVYKLLGELESREVSGPASELVSNAKDASWLMEDGSKTLYFCGLNALEAYNNHKGIDYSITEEDITSFSSSKGISLKDLSDISGTFGTELIPVNIGSDLSAIPTPAIFHWKFNHYGVILDRIENRYLVSDTIFGTSKWIDEEVIKEEGSGYFLIAKSDVLGSSLKKIGDQEASFIYGKGGPILTDDGATRTNDHQVGNPCSNYGMPQYSFHTLLASLSISDTPIWHSSSVGPSPVFTLRYNQREARQPVNFLYTNFGHKWVSNWISYIETDPAAIDITLFPPGGGSEDFKNTNSSEPVIVTGSDFTSILSDGVLIEKTMYGFEIQYPDGSRVKYEQGDENSTKFFMTEVIDNSNNVLTFDYDPTEINNEYVGIRLRHVIDALDYRLRLEYLDEVDPQSPDYFLVSKVIEDGDIISPLSNGREAHIEYNNGRKVSAITDMIGLRSSFEYDLDFIEAMTTPYGTTIFETSFLGGVTIYRDVQATDPHGDSERVAYVLERSFNVSDEDRDNVPDGIINSYNQKRNSYYWDKLTYKTAPDPDNGSQALTAFYNHATIYNFLYSKSFKRTSPILGSIKKPTSNRVFFTYPDQDLYIKQGSSRSPERIGVKVAEDESSVMKYQLGTTDEEYSIITSFEYNDRNKPTKITDPLGREVFMEYTNDDINLTKVKTYDHNEDEIVTLTEVQYSYTGNNQYNPSRIVYATGFDSKFCYNDKGQLLQVTDQIGNHVRYTYTIPDLDGGSNPITVNCNGTSINSSHGYLEKVEAIDGSNQEVTIIAEYEYDEFYRVSKVTSTDGYVTEYDYDELDRPTLITYPDSKTTEYTYDRLHLSRVKDPENYTTNYMINAVGELSAMIDANGDMTRYEYCDCGSLSKLIDPDGKETEWLYDDFGRIETRIEPDGETTTFEYDESTSLVSSVTNQLGVRTEYTYHIDTTLRSIKTFANGEELPEETISYDYDKSFGWQISSTGNTGTMAYEFKRPLTIPPTSSPDSSIGMMIGASKTSITPGAFLDYEFDYTYDEFGSMIGVTADNDFTGFSTTYDDGLHETLMQDIDYLNRYNKSITSLGQTTYHFDSDREYIDYTTFIEDPLSSTDSFKTDFTYDAPSGASLLVDDPYLTDVAVEHYQNSILQKTLVDHNFEYNEVALLTNFTQNLENSDTKREFSYDEIYQLTGVDELDPATNNLLGTQRYKYDKSYNRTILQVNNSSGNTITNYEYNNVNELTAAGGTDGDNVTALIEGTVSVPGEVSVNSNPARIKVDATGSSAIFTAEESLDTTQDNSVSLQATQYGGGGTPLSKNYNVSINAPPKTTFVYNDKGSMVQELDAGLNTLVEYEWDLYERLVKVTKGTQVTEIDYDHYDRWIRIRELTLDTGTHVETPQKTRHYVWMDFSIARQVIIDHTNADSFKTVDYFGEGEIHHTASTEDKYLYATDYLGSIVQIYELDGTVVREFAYDIWGERTETFTATGAPEASFGFTGHYDHEWSGLIIAPLRAYRADLGRWIKRDPIKELGGVNLYAYAYNNPANFGDPLGLITGSGIANSIDSATGGAADRAASTCTGFKADLHNFGVYSADSALNLLSDLLRFGQGSAEAYEGYSVDGDKLSGLDRGLAVLSDVDRGATLIGIGGAAKGITGTAKAADAIGDAAGIGRALNKLDNVNPCSSFVAGTLVHTTDGTKPIEDIEIWDKVYAYDEVTGEVFERTVTQVTSRDVEELIVITFDETGDVIHTTSEHPFWILEENGWVEAAQLTAGQTVLLIDGAAIELASVEKENRSTTVHNFAVYELQNYFVGNVGVLVHNAKCDIKVRRFGKEPESAGKLASDAAKAETNGFPHGVSVTSKPGGGLKPTIGEVEKSFPVHKTGNNPNHYTVELPKPVTDNVANTFNSLFHRK